MNIRKSSSTTLFFMLTVLLLTGSLTFGADNAPMTPEFAAKKENFRKQHEQRITHEKRKAAADRLKAERLRVYQAKQAVKHSKPESNDKK